MLQMGDPQTVWLNVTNIVLGLITLICCVIIGKTVLEEFRGRAAQKSEVADDVFAHGELGLTMADGGERLEKEK